MGKHSRLSLGAVTTAVGRLMQENIEFKPDVDYVVKAYLRNSVCFGWGTWLSWHG